MKNEKLYLKIERNIVVRNYHVKLSDIAKMECSDALILRTLKELRIYEFPSTATKEKEVIFSILKIFELIHEKYPGLDIRNEGETDFLITYVPTEPAKWLEHVKVAFLSVVIFFGAAFTIMAFNNDVGITDVFDKVYLQVMGTQASGITEMEVGYCIGLAAGIIIFFNHFGKKKITKDPTPIQVQMRKYANDIDSVFIENAGRKGNNIDVD